MESWFLADKQVMEVYYKTGFRQNALPSNPRVEQIPKGDVMDGLKRATRHTHKGKYDKGRDSFEILARVDPEKVSIASPYAKRLLAKLSSPLGSNAS